MSRECEDRLTNDDRAIAALDRETEAIVRMATEMSEGYSVLREILDALVEANEESKAMRAAVLMTVHHGEKGWDRGAYYLPPHCKGDFESIAMAATRGLLDEEQGDE